MKKGDIIGRLHEIDGAAPINLEAKVNWVVDGEAGVTYTSPDSWKGGSNIVNVSEWRLLVESAPSFQSSVESMTENQLKDSLDTLRRTRIKAPAKLKAGVKVKAVKKSDPLMKALEEMDEDKKAELMKKLGMV